MSESIAIYGITGALGREVHIALEVEHEGLGELLPIAGPRSAGQTVRWRGASLPVRGPLEVDATDVDIAVFATRSDVVMREAPRLVAAGARVIDASGSLAAPPLPAGMRVAAPLVWPGLAKAPPVDLELASIVALPGAVTSTLAPILEALSAAESVHGIPHATSCDIVALCGASAAGRVGIEALSRQSVGLLGSQAIIDPRPFDHVLAFNTLTEPPTQTVVAEARLQAELQALVPAFAALRPNLVTVWVPAFSGLALIVTLRAATPFPSSALAAIQRALEAHPDLHGANEDDASEFADPDDGPAPEPPDEVDDEDDGDEAKPPPPPPGAAESMALRDTLDQDEVRLTAPSVTMDGALRLVAFADPLHRTALAAQTIITRWALMADEDA